MPKCRICSTIELELKSLTPNHHLSFYRQISFFLFSCWFSYWLCGICSFPFYNLSISLRSFWWSFVNESCAVHSWLCLWPEWISSMGHSAKLGSCFRDWSSQCQVIRKKSSWNTVTCIMYVSLFYWCLYNFRNTVFYVLKSYIISNLGKKLPTFW